MFVEGRNKLTGRERVARAARGGARATLSSQQCLGRGQMRGGSPSQGQHLCNLTASLAGHTPRTGLLLALGEHIC